MKLNEKILTLRKNKGLSQEELAEKLNVSRQTVSRWEVGTAQPDASNLLQISTLFHVTADYLLHDDFEENDRSIAASARPTIQMIISCCIAALGLIGNFIIYIISRCVKVMAPLKYYDHEAKMYKYLYDGTLRINYRYFIEEYHLIPLVIILSVLSVLGILLAVYHTPSIKSKINDFKNTSTKSS